MFKSIHPLLTGQVLSQLADMGHGDEIVIFDANFPAASLGCRLIRMPGTSATDVLGAVLSVLPLDDFVEALGAAVNAPGERQEIYPEFEAALAQAEGRTVRMEPVEHFAFYDRARAASAVIATGERRPSTSSSRRVSCVPEKSAMLDAISTSGRSRAVIMAG